MLLMKHSVLSSNALLTAGDVDYHSSLDTLEKLHLDADSNEFTNTGSLNSWFYSYTTWLKTTTDTTITAVLNTGKFWTKQNISATAHRMQGTWVQILHHRL